MQKTRESIVQILKKRGQATVDELSRELGLTSVTVRHHIEILRQEGVVDSPEPLRRSGPGRPRHPRPAPSARRARPRAAGTRRRG